MIIKMNVTSEHVFLNPKLDKIKCIIEKTQLENDDKYGYSYGRKFEVRCDVELLDKTENKTMKITINNFRVHHGISKTIKTSRGQYELIKPTKLTNSIEGKLCKKVIEISMKRNNLHLV